jgi:hypothetical protein
MKTKDSKFVVRDLTNRLKPSYHPTEDAAYHWSMHLWNWNPDARLVVEAVDEVVHDKDCHLGDNWKDCPACKETRT